MVRLGASQALVGTARRFLRANLTATLAAGIFITSLGGWHEPKAAARLAENSGPKQPFVEAYRFFDSHA